MLFSFSCPFCLPDVWNSSPARLSYGFRISGMYFCGSRHPRSASPGRISPDSAVLGRISPGCIFLYSIASGCVSLYSVFPGRGFLSAVPAGAVLSQIRRRCSRMSLSLTGNRISRLCSACSLILPWLRIGLSLPSLSIFFLLTISLSAFSPFLCSGLYPQPAARCRTVRSPECHLQV